MKVTLLSPDLSSNCLGRALVLADVLSLDHQVRVVGPRMGAGIWPPALDHPAPLVEVPGRPWPRFTRSLGSLLREISGDVVVAVKPRFPSLGTALLARGRTGTPMVLDLDDDETALRPVSLLPRALVGDLLSPDGGTSRWLMRRAISQADAVTVASRGLQRLHGGELIPHVKDTERLKPLPGLREEWRERLSLGPEPVALFLGTPRPWKGVEDAAGAIQALPFLATLLVVGADDTDYSRRLAAMPRVRLEGMVPIEALPGFLSAADLVVIPQRRHPVTRFQMPSKLFDAMAMARPVVATDVSDISLVLGEGRGVVVPPGSLSRLMYAMGRLLEDPEEAREMGGRARAWCVEHASLASAREPMNRALERAVEGGRR